MAQKVNIETRIDKERAALYACSKAKCKECPYKRETHEFCMKKLLTEFNEIIDELRGAQNG